MSSSKRFIALICWLAVLSFLFLRPLAAQVGGLDLNFNPGAISNGASSGAVRAQLQISGGQSVIAGSFTSVGGVARGNIARLNQDGTLDTAFGSGAGANGPIYAIAADASGNIVIGGDFTQYNGVARNRIARLTPLGALDTTFNPSTGCNGPVYALVLFNGSIYLGGDFTTCNGSPRNRLAQLYGDGLLDQNTFGGGTNNVVRAFWIDQNTYIINEGGDFTSAGGSTRTYFAQFSLFSNQLISSINLVFNGPVNAIAASSDPSYSSTGKLFIGGDFTAVGTSQRGRLAAFVTGNGAMTLDGTFNFWLDAPCRQISVITPNKVFVAGDFSYVNGQPRARLAAFNYVSSSSGSSSSAYWDILAGFGETGPDSPILSLQITSEGKPLIGGLFANFGATPCKPFLRLYNEAGNQLPAAPTGFAATTLSDSQIYLAWGGSPFASTYQLEASNDGSTGWTSIYSGSAVTFRENNLLASQTRFYRVRATNTNGSSANATASATTSATPWTGSGSVLSSQPNWGLNGSVSAILRQPDGKILVAGAFTNILGTNRKYIARLLPDLTLDPTFDPGTGPNSPIQQLALAPNGAIYLYGTFTKIGSANRDAIARINADGTLDTAFDTMSTWTFSAGIRSQPDGKLVVYGNFQTFFGSPRNYLARLNLDGTIDASFAPVLSSFLEALAVQPDGKLLLGGWFSRINGILALNFARLNSTGNLDTSFTGTEYDISIKSLVSLRNGKNLVSGTFTLISGSSRVYLARLNANGDADTTFNPGTSTNAPSPLIFPQPDGKLVLAGSFTTFAGVSRWKFARLNSDGTLDSTFKGEAGPGDGAINSVISLPDGSLLVGGTFMTFGVTSRSYLVQVKGNPYPAAPATPTNLAGQAVSKSSIRLTWNDLPTEYSWRLERRALGDQSWVAIADLEWDTTTFTDTGLTTGATYEYHLLASNGAGNSAFSSVANVRTLKSYEQWKLDAGFSLATLDSDDTDGDGIGLLTEYALGLDPATPQLAGAPVSQMVGGVFALSYFHLRNDIFYIVETSTDLQNWTTTGVEQGFGLFPIASVPADGSSREYLRLRVSVP